MLDIGGMIALATTLPVASRLPCLLQTFAETLEATGRTVARKSSLGGPYFCAGGA